MFSLIPSDANDPQGLMRRKEPNKQTNKNTHNLKKKINENSMEAKSQQKFYNKAAIVVISSKLSLWSIRFQDLVQKIMKCLIIIHYFRFMLRIAFTL